MMSSLESPSENSTPYHSEASFSDADEVSAPETETFDDSPVPIGLESISTERPHPITSANLAVGLLSSAESLRRKTMLSIIDKLHHLGVNKDIELPRIAVIGQQSAGKSSLVEAFTGIKLPRAGGTCTRCATECLVKEAKHPWRCDVYIFRTSDHDGRHGNPEQIPFGPTIYNPDEVTERVRFAQRAILNPERNESFYLHDNDSIDDSHSPLAFSQDYISIQISGPGLVDLSFVDLPGLIHSVGHDGNKDDIPLVRKLTVKYIEKKSCLILLTVSCETDMETQEASTLASEFDPTGERTIGVLTKPDRIEPGEETIWMQRVLNQDKGRFLRLGWFCVKLLDPRQLKKGLSREEANRQELAFFTTTSPWSTLSMQTHNLGVAKLVVSLSATLSDLIAKRIPELEEELRNVYDQTNKELRTLPKSPPQDAYAEMMKMISEFSAHMKQLVDGRPGEGELLQQLRDEQRRFRDEIRSTAPDFRPYLSNEAKDQVEMDFLRCEEADTFDQGEIVYIAEIKKMIADAITRELPGFIPFSVTSKLISDSTQDWHRHSLKYFDEAHRILSKHVKKLITQHFKKFEYGNLSSKVASVIQEAIDKNGDRVRKQLEWLHSVESFPFTQNVKYMQDYKDKFLSRYRTRWVEDRTGENGSPRALEVPIRAASEQEFAFQSAQANLSKMGYHVEDRTQLAMLRDKDEYEDALNIMSQARAYVHVAYKRFVDNVPMAVDHDFVCAIGRDAQDVLYDAFLKGDVREKCASYLKEHPSTSTMRDHLTAKLQRLNQARFEISTF